MQNYDLFNKSMREQILSWIAEDVGTGDMTTVSTVSPHHVSTAVLHSKESGVIAGLPIAELVFSVVDEQVQFRRKVSEGMRVQAGTIIAEVEGTTHSLLTAERLALNLLQRLSGIATKTSQYVQALEGLPTRVVDTRKTTPGHRQLEKYAVRVGGGANHRFGLYDAVMIKDNHIKAAGGILAAVQAARQRIPHTMKIEVEVESLEQLQLALEAGADIIMLDNMAVPILHKAVATIRKDAPHIIIEASGGITLESIRKVAETGVDIISVGALTHSVQALDISLDLDGKKEESSCS